MEQNIDRENKEKEELILKQERIKKEVNDRKQFGEEVKKNFLPQQNNNLKKEREENIKKIKGINKYK